MTRIARQPVLWLAAIFALLLSYLGTFYPSRLVQLHTHWTTAGDLDMGYILLALSAYFSYKNLGSNKVQPNYLLLPAVILLTAGFVLSQALDIKTLFFLCLALSLPLFSAIVLGFASTRNIIIAWSVVLMAMPFWYLAIPFLQTLTVKVVSYLASLLSLTVLVEGNYFTVTTGVVHVAGGCSGLKYFMTALSLALISSAFNRRRFRHALLSLAIAATLAMIGNWIRVFILLLIAYYEGVSHPLMEDHDTLGWIVFGAVMLPWFFIDRHFDAEGEQESPVKQDTSQPLKQQILSLTACTVLLIISQLALSPPENREYQVSQPKLPKTLNGLTLDTTRATNWKPHFPQPTNLTRGLYGAFGDQLDLYILTYLNNSNVEMANSQNTIFDKNRWQLINDYAWTSDLHPNVRIRIALAKAGRTHRVVYYWYKHGAQFANSIGSSKIAQLKKSYLDIHESQLVALSKECNLKCQSNLTPTQGMLDTIIQLHIQSNSDISSSSDIES